MICALLEKYWQQAVIALLAAVSLCSGCAYAPIAPTAGLTAAEDPEVAHIKQRDQEIGREIAEWKQMPDGPEKAKRQREITVECEALMAEWREMHQRSGEALMMMARMQEADARMREADAMTDIGRAELLKATSTPAPTQVQIIPYP